MYCNNFLNEFKHSNSINVFIKLVKQKYNKRNINTIQRDYYRLVKQYENDSNLINHLQLTQLKKLKLQDMLRLKINITEKLLRQEGFSIEEIKEVIKVKNG
jgi:hypothetical protein